MGDNNRQFSSPAVKPTVTGSNKEAPSALDKAAAESGRMAPGICVALVPDAWIHLGRKQTGRGELTFTWPFLELSRFVESAKTPVNTLSPSMRAPRVAASCDICWGLSVEF